MSRTDEMSRILLDWYCNLPQGNVKNPIARIEAITASRGKNPREAIDTIVEHFPEALEVYVGYPSHLTVDKGDHHLYAVSEMRHLSNLPGNQYLRVHTVGVESAFDAMINLKQRYDWEMTSDH